MTNPEQTPKNWLSRIIAYSREPVNSLTHGIGAVLALIGMIWLMWMARDMPGRMVTLAIFGTTMVLLYTASSVMHFYNGSETVLHRLNQLDHAAIYLLIAGSYTPFTYAFMVGHPYWRWGMLIIIWALAVVGVVLKLGFNMYGHISTIFYVAMGWVAVIAIPQWVSLGHLSPMLLIAAGGRRLHHRRSHLRATPPELPPSLRASRVVAPVRDGWERVSLHRSGNLGGGSVDRI